jgi:hypothetical protein
MSNNNPISKHTAKKNKSNRDRVNISGVKGHTTTVDVTGDENQTITSVTGSGDIAINANLLSTIDPQFKKAIVEFNNLVSSEIKQKGVSISQDQQKSIEEEVNKLAKEVKGIKADEEAKVDEDKKDSIRTRLHNIAEKIIDSVPSVAESLASFTPLAPFGKAIGKGVGYFSDLLKKKLLNR